MAHYDTFREQLAIKYPAFGHALWDPNPRNPDKPVQVGDVGFIRRGKFCRLFNALLPADDPSHELGVPEYHEPLVPSLLDHIDKGSCSSNNYCSAGVGVEPDLGLHSGPDGFRQLSFQYERTRGAAVLSLPVATQREDTHAQGDFGRWIVKHIDSCFAFARNLGLGIERMEEIILVDARVTFGVRVEGEGPDTNINFQRSPDLVRGAVINQGPEGMNLPDNQCVFIRGFRVARPFWILPKHLKAAAGPSPDPGGYDGDPDTEYVSISAITKYRDPLHLLLDHLAEQASDCDMLLVHDNDLVTVNGDGHDALPETLEPDLTLDLLRRSNIEIQKVLCDSTPTNGPSDSNTDMATMKVAMLPMTFQNWNTASPSLLSPISAPSIDFGRTSESRGTPPPAMPGSLPVPTIVQNALVGSCSHQSADQPHRPPFSLGFTHPQNLEPMTAAWSLSQGHAGVENTLGKPSSQVVHQSLTEDNRTDRTMVTSPLRRPLTVEWPAAPQEFDSNGQHNLPPQMPDPLPLFRNTGRRKALLIGTNYSLHPRPDFRLKKCIEDAYGVANFLRENLGFAHDDVRVMTDETPSELPTRANILDAMRQLVYNAQPHDNFFFYFSGHGVQIKDTNGDKPDGLDECICAMDYNGDDPYPNANTPGLIVDNVMHELMVKALPRQCRLTAIFDSCHSGTALNLPYTYDSNGDIQAINHPDILRPLIQKASYAHVVSLSASKDDKGAFETKRGGALRRAFIECVRKFGDSLTYRELLWNVDDYMREHQFPQRLQLSSSHEIDTNTSLTKTGYHALDHAGK